jgi:carboxylesterase type B
MPLSPILYPLMFCLPKRHDTATWRYLFNASFPTSRRFHGFGSPHGAEIRYVFGNLLHPTTAEQHLLSRLMQKTWADFAKNPENGPGWPALGKGPDGNNIGYFGSSNKIQIRDASQVDSDCDLFHEYYEGRA